MSIISLVLIISSTLLIGITGEEKFCQKDRNLLLGGVFNYDRIIFSYSWKEVNSVQFWLVWRYEFKDNRLIAIGQDVNVDDIFPSIPLFRAGFGLTMKCSSSDTTCKTYRQLVFIFFQTSYKVFRFANDVFATEVDNSKIPWGLKPRGNVNDWFFGIASMDKFNAIMFMSGYQSQIFVVSNDVLYVSAVDINAPALKWSQLAQSKELVSTLGGIVIGSDLYLNKNEEPDSILIKYDQNGKESDRISVWEFFNCDKSEEQNQSFANLSVGAGSEDVKRPLKTSYQIEIEKNNNLAQNIIICVVAVILLTNIIAGVFWFSVYRKKRNQQV